MERTRIRKTWGALLLALCLMLSGCGEQLDLEADDEEDIAPWQTTDEETEEELGEPGLTSFALAYHDRQTLDPMTCRDGAQLQLTALLYEPLFQLDEGFRPQPLLCSDYSVSEDGLVYTLVIRQGVTFSDGSILKASDAAASLRRAMGSERYGNRLRDVRQVTVRGEWEVVLTLSRPNWNLAALLDIPVVKGASDGDTAPAGTGPYLFITSSEGAYLSANPDWWQGRELPLERIELMDAKDTDTVLYLFTSRETHVYATDLTQGSAALSGSLDAVEVPTATLQFIGINARRGVLQDQALRQALWAGTPRETVVEGYLSSHALPAQFPISPLADGYPDALEAEYSLDSYHQALTVPGEGGETPGERTVTLLVNGDNATKTAIAQYLAQSLSLEGVLRVEVEALAWSEYLQALADGDFDLYYGEVRLTCDWDVSELIGTGGSLNYGGWSSEETDHWLEAFRNGESGQFGLYRHLQETVPLIPVCFKNDSILTHSGTVEGIEAAAANIFLNFPDWTIHMAASEK